MSRYLNIENITFTTIDNETVQVPDIRPIPDEAIGLEVDILSNQLLDEVAVKPEVYGDFGEFLSYRLFDANIIDITEENFSLENVRRLKVPR